MRVLNWESVEESTPFEKLPAGGYVVKIVDVEDIDRKEYLNVVYDIAEGEHAGFFSSDFALRNPWSHRFVRSYKETARGMFKAFLLRLEESNPGFSIAAWQKKGDERELVGLELGAVVQYEDYTNDAGDDKERLDVVGVYSAADIRAGKFTVPERKDNRTKDSNPYSGQAEQPPVSVYDDLPFA